MNLKKLISGLLALTLLIGLFPTPNAQAVKRTYPTDGYCTKYVTPTSKGGFGYDRIEVPNPLMSDYLEGLDPNAAVAEMNRIKEDHLCMQRADIEYMLTKITDETRRVQLQKELEDIIKSENKIKDKLKLLKERDERIAKFLEALRALAQVGTAEAKKKLIDKNAVVIKEAREALDEFLVMESSTEGQLKADVADDLKNLKGKNSSETQKKIRSKKAELIQKIRNDYEPTKKKFESLKIKYRNEVNQKLDQLFAQERSKYNTELRKEIDDTEELSKKLEAFDVLFQEKKDLYNAKIDDIFRSEEMKISHFMDKIEDVIGPVEVSSQSSWQPQTLVAKSSLIASTSNNIVSYADDIFMPEILVPIDNFLTTSDPLVSDLISILNSPDFQLTIALNQNTKLTMKIIADVENGNFESLVKTVQGFNDDLKNNLRQEINSSMQKIEQDIVSTSREINEILDDDITKDARDRLEMIQKDFEEQLDAEIELKVLEKLKESGLSDEVNEVIAEIARLYGGYEDFLIEYFKERTLQKRLLVNSLKRYKKQTTEAYKTLIEEFKKYPELRDSTKDILKFILLSSITFKTRKVNSTKASGYLNRNMRKIVSYYAKIDKKVDEKEKDLIGKAYGGVSSEMSIFDKAIMDLAGIQKIKVYGPVYLSPLKQLRISIYAQRAVQGKKEDFSDTLDTVGNADQTNKIRTHDIVRVKDHTYLLNKERGIVIRQKNGVSNLIQFFDDRDRLIKSLDRSGYIQFFEYDNKNRLIKRVTAESKQVWDSDKQDFILPAFDATYKRGSKTRYKIVDKTAWKYIGAGGNVAERKEYAPKLTKGRDIPTKILRYKYIFEDMIVYEKGRSNDFSDEYKKNLQNFIDKDITPVKARDYLPLFRDTISRLQIINPLKNNKIVGTVEFLYDEDFDLEMIKGLQGRPKSDGTYADEFVSFGMLGQGSLKKKYPGVIIKRKVMIRDDLIFNEYGGKYKINPVYFIDSNGVVLQDVGKIEELMDRANMLVKKAVGKAPKLSTICEYISEVLTTEQKKRCDELAAKGDVADRATRGILEGLSEGVVFQLGEVVQLPGNLYFTDWGEAWGSTGKDVVRTASSLKQAIPSLLSDETFDAIVANPEETAYGFGKVLGNIGSAFIPLLPFKAKIIGKIKSATVKFKRLVAGLKAVKTVAKIVTPATKAVKGITSLVPRIKNKHIRKILERYFEDTSFSSFWLRVGKGKASSIAYFKKIIKVVNKVDRFFPYIKSAKEARKRTKGLILSLKKIEKYLPDHLKVLFKKSNNNKQLLKNTIKNNKNRKSWRGKTTEEIVKNLVEKKEEVKNILKKVLPSNVSDKQIDINVKASDSIRKKLEVNKKMNKKINKKNDLKAEKIEELSDVFRGTVEADDLEGLAKRVNKFEESVKNSEDVKIITRENKFLDSLKNDIDSPEAITYKIEIKGEIFELQFKTAQDKILGEIQHGVMDAAKMSEHFPDLVKGGNKLSKAGADLKEAADLIYHKGKFDEWQDLFYKYMKYESPKKINKAGDIEFTEYIMNKDFSYTRTKNILKAADKLYEERKLALEIEQQIWRVVKKEGIKFMPIIAQGFGWTQRIAIAKKLDNLTSLLGVKKTFFTKFIEKLGYRFGGAETYDFNKQIIEIVTSPILSKSLTLNTVHERAHALQLSILAKAVNHRLISKKHMAHIMYSAAKHGKYMYGGTTELAADMIKDKKKLGLIYESLKFSNKSLRNVEGHGIPKGQITKFENFIKKEMDNLAKKIGKDMVEISPKTLKKLEDVANNKGSFLYLSKVDSKMIMRSKIVISTLVAAGGVILLEVIIDDEPKIIQFDIEEVENMLDEFIYADVD